MTRLQLRRGFIRARDVFAAESLVFFIAYLAVAAGVPIIIDPTIFAPVSMQLNLSGWLVRAWGADLATGGLLCGYGLLSERPRIERAGLAFLFTGSMLFATVILTYAGLAALLPALTYSLLSITAIARFRKLRKVQEGIDFAREFQNNHPTT